jgi:hypothetical protein
MSSSTRGARIHRLAVGRGDHLLQTIHTGPGRWTVRQYPDGTIMWTRPADAPVPSAPPGHDSCPKTAPIQWDTTALATPPTHHPSDF